MIKSTLFPSEQLGKAMDHYDTALDGIADFVCQSGLPARPLSDHRRGELPFLIGNAKESVRRRPVWDQQETRFAFGITLTVRAGFIQGGSAGRPVRTRMTAVSHCSC